MEDKKRVFIGITDIAGYYANIAKELTLNGYDVTFFFNNQNIYNPGVYKVATNLWLMRAILFAQKQYRTKKKSIVRTFWLFIRELFTPFLLFWAARHHDVFIFGFGHSFIPGCYDLWLLKKMNKRIISNIGHGSDSRPAYIDGANFSKTGKPMQLYLIRFLSRFIRKRTKRIERYSNVVINAPYTSHFNEKKFVNWFELGIPMKIEKHSFINNQKNTIHILHAPSRPFDKGTFYIRDAIKLLKEKGYKIEYIELTGVPHNIVLEELQNCDFVVDQIFSDGPMSGFTAEAAFYGKPAVVGGYGLKQLKTYISETMYPPSHICYPDEIIKAIELLIVDENYRLSLGVSAQNFIFTKWTPEMVTQRYMQLINNTIPDSWFFNPASITYLHGGGLHEDKCKELVGQMINKYGIASLQLKHRPDLEKAFVEFSTK